MSVADLAQPVAQVDLERPLLHQDFRGLERPRKRTRKHRPDRSLCEPLRQAPSLAPTFVREIHSGRPREPIFRGACSCPVSNQEYACQFHTSTGWGFSRCSSAERG